MVLSPATLPWIPKSASDGIEKRSLDATGEETVGALVH